MFYHHLVMRALSKKVYFQGEFNIFFNEQELDKVIIWRRKRSKRQFKYEI